jgi:hydrogenase maturation protease
LKPLVIGLGNRMGGDDAAGLEVARLVRERAPAAEIVAHEREPSDLITLWDGAPLAVVIDAVEGGAPGGVHTFELAADDPIPGSWWRSRATSTHALQLAEVIEIARSLGRLPPRLVLIGVSGETFETGAQVSEAVRRGIDVAATAVLTQLAVHRDSA